MMPAAITTSTVKNFDLSIANVPHSDDPKGK